MNLWPSPPPNSIIKIADDTAAVGLITNNSETAYREEVRALGMWCQENNLSLNVNKTKDDFRKQQREHPLSTSTGQQWRRWKVLSSLAYTNLYKLKWYTHTDSVVKNLRRLKKFSLSPKILTNLHLQMHN